MNAVNMTAVLRIYGIIDTTPINFDEHLLGPESFNTQLSNSKSFTFVYASNKTETKNRVISLGQRQANDYLLNVKTKLVKKLNHFAEDDFIYENNLKFITKIQFTFDVSITYELMCLKIGLLRFVSF